MITFTKMHGLGNDFMVINGIDQKINLTPTQIQVWGNRHTGIGFDQLMLIEKAKDSSADFNYRIFNADGSEAEQCGNGVRCIAQFIFEKKLSDKKILRLATPFATMICELKDKQQVTVNMGKPNFAPATLPFEATQSIYYDLPYHDRSLSFGAVSVGNPHVVFEVPDTHQAEVKIIGQFLNQHPKFPKGVNVEFMQILDRGHIRLRVYERGAAETLACGTGACAAVSVGQLWRLLDQKVLVDLPGGQLIIEHTNDNEILMTGPAITVFDGITV